VKKLQHNRQSDQALDRELREIIETLNELVGKLGDPGSSFPSDSEAPAVQAVTVKGNLYSVAIKTKDGMVYSIPGLFLKTNSIPSVATVNQILIANADGTFTPKAHP
jgi:hypothetical protein